MSGSHYQPIRLGTGEFRILTLHPSATFSADIECTLMNVSFEFHPAYEALSYVWGPKTAQLSEITLEGKVKSVTKNLANALRHLRQAEHARNLWVDALCIDQQHIDERDDQVMHMREIYQHCSVDLFWLGNDASIIEDGIAAMDSIGSITNLSEELQQSYIFDRGYLKTEPSPGTTQSISEGLQALFYNPFAWSRVWIMQEIAFAPSVVLLAGNSAPLPWSRVDAFLEVDKYVAKHGFPDAFHGAFNHGMGHFNDALGMFLAAPQILAHQRRIVATMQQRSDRSAPTSSLLDVLARFRHTDATDPRDMVFALLGLSSEPLSITPTYHDSVRTVFTNTATTLLRASNNLDLLCQSPWGPHPDNKSLPSWVPDFAARASGQILFAQRGIYDASGGTAPTPCVVRADGGIELEGWDAGGVERMAYSEVRVAQSLGAWMPEEVVWEGVRAGNGSMGVFLEGREGEGEGRRKGGEEKGDPRLVRFEEFWRTVMVDCKRLPMARLEEEDLVELRRKWEAWLRVPWVERTESGESVREEESEAIDECVRSAWGMRFAVLEDGRYAMVGSRAMKGDRVVILKGAKTPVVLRKVKGKEEDTWRLIGACYAHGLMDGEIVSKEGCSTRTFVIS